MRGTLVLDWPEPGCTLAELGDASVLVDRPAGRVWWSWNDDAPPRQRRRDGRRSVRFLRKLGTVSFSEEELDGGMVTLAGTFGVARCAAPRLTAASSQAPTR